MTSQEVQYAIVLAETLNFSKAARIMHTTQPAFSRMVTRLEEQVGCKLFFRNTKSVSLTPEGKIFIDSMKNIEAIYSSTLRAVNDLQKTGDKFSVGLGAEFIFYDLVPDILEFKDAHPDIFVEIMAISMVKITELLRTQRIDLGTIFTDLTQFGNDLEYEVIDQIPLHLVVNKINPLSEKDKLLPEDLKNEKIIALAANYSDFEIGSYGAPLVMLNRKYGLHLKPAKTAETTQESMLDVSANQGVCFLTSKLSYIVPPNCRMIPIDGVDFNRVALWRKGYENPLLRELLEILKKK